MRNYIIFDTETTGLIDRKDRLIEIGAIRVIDGVIPDLQDKKRVLHMYFDPLVEIPPHVVAVHNLSRKVLVEEKGAKPLTKEDLVYIADFFRGYDIVAHNAKFDVGFLNAEALRLKLSDDFIGKYCAVKVLDTQEIAGKLYSKYIDKTRAGKLDPNKLHGLKLDNLAEFLKIDRTQRDIQGHGALLDSVILAQVYSRMLNDDNQVTKEKLQQQLQQIQELGGPLPDIDFKSFNIKLQTPKAPNLNNNPNFSIK